MSEDQAALVVAGLGAEQPTGVEDIPGGIRVFFSDVASRDRGAELARAVEPGMSCHAVDVPDEHWAERSQAALQPVRVGRLVVAPPWAAWDDTACLAAGVVQVIIQPAMGFGTGHHASTRLCLDLLQDIELTSAWVTDVGTGSGVLALAAAHLGAREVVGLDHDADALTSARDSAALNPSVSVTWREVDLRGMAPPAPADVVCANLTGDLLTREAGAICALAKPDGALILSGILDGEAASLTSAFGALGWRPVATRQEDEWVGLRLERDRPAGPTSPIASTTR
jgi:ribosomal protein L11 methyltransferase